ncbi:MAG: glycosyltransferase family 9 protein [Deltaproteobacteria bacterium]|jgi:heptosyltransferase-1/heptosyltransferase-2|nr:glycosyltransferase family 9 protein [Deltaproteobacteria bacterium]
MKDYKHILVIKMSALGDIIHALPSLNALRNLYPKAIISWLVEPQFSGLLPGKPYIDDLIIFYKNDLKKKTLREKIKYLWQLRKDLHTRKFDLVLDLQGLMKSTLIGILSGCHRRVGYWELREGSFLFTKPIYGPNANGHIIERYLDVIRSLGPISNEVVFPLPDYSESRAKLAESLKNKGIKERLALFFPGAGWQSKIWPMEKYAALAKKLHADGLSVVIGGGAADEAMAKAIIEQSSPCKPLDLTGQTDLPGLMALVSLGTVALGSDTGPLHLAAATGTSTVSLFGPSSGHRAGTYGPFSRYVATTAPCSPCFKRICPKKFICMNMIEVDQVYRVCSEVLHLTSPNLQL